MTEQEVATDLKARLTKLFPDSVWQVRAAAAAVRRPRKASMGSLGLMPLLLATQVFVGRNFGAFVTYEEGKYIYFYINQIGFCVYAA